VVNANNLTSVPTSEILRSIGKAKLVITIEEHTIWGGLGGLVCEAIAKSGISKRVATLGIREGFVSEVGTQAYLRSRIGIDSKGIVNQALTLYEENNGSESL
jgi:transketolase